MSALKARIGPADLVLELDVGWSLRVDAAGRWLTARVDGRLFRRTVMGGAVEVDARRGAPRDVADVGALHERVRALAVAAGEALREGAALALTGAGGQRAAVVERLKRAADWTAERHGALAAAFLEAYPEDVEILPPDRYLDVVVMPALGCPNGTCPFCAFYRGKPLRPLSAADFAAHLAAVARLLGPAIVLKRGVFLGSASALSLSQRRLVAVLGEVEAALGRRPLGVAAFWDPDHCPERTAAEWAALAAGGLGDAYVGLETGDSALREENHKSGDLETLVRRLRVAREGGVRTHVIVLAGLGGEGRQEAHRAATAAVVARLGLSRRERVYVSPLEGSVGDLAGATAALGRAVRARTAGRVVPYAMENFRYYA